MNNELINKAITKIKTVYLQYGPKIYDAVNKKIPLDKLTETAKKYLAIAEKYLKIAFEYKLYATYLPFIGWLIPFYYNNDDEFAMHHGKQAFMLSAMFGASLIIIYFTTYFVPVKLKIIKLILIILIYLFELVYFSAAVIGTRWIISKEKKSFPYIDKYSNLINI